MAPNQCQPTLGPIIATLNQGPISQRIYELIIQIFKNIYVLLLHDKYWLHQVTI